MASNATFRARLAKLASAAVLVTVTAGCEGSALRSRTTAAVPPPEEPQTQTFTATAYALEGLTAAGTRARRGIVAADPDVLPLGTRIHVHGAGHYSGEYVVEDTGAKIKGRIIDIKVGSTKEAMQFGRRKVQVEVLERGNGDRKAIRAAAAESPA
jgi:3D (Asp-Asp-Asp) domain-containing protein